MISISDKEYEALQAAVAAAVKQQQQPKTPALTWGVKFAEALAAAQGAIGVVAKNRKADVEGKNGVRGYSYTYATLASVLEAVREPLAAQGLAVVQEPSFDGRAVVTVRTIILHTSGEYLQHTLAMPTTRTDPQGVGIVIAYARRYALVSLLSVATDDDKDGNLSPPGGAKVPPKPPVPARQPAPQSPVKPAAPPSPASPASQAGPPDEPPQNPTDGLEVPEAWQPGPADVMLARIREAQTNAELDALVPEIQRLPEHVKKSLKADYSARSKELMKAAKTATAAEVAA